MADRKVYADSITSLSDAKNLNAYGLMVNDAGPDDKSHNMRIFFSLAMPVDRQAELEAKVAAGETVSAADLKSKYIAILPTQRRSYPGSRHRDTKT